MTGRLRIALAQINAAAGDLPGNAARIRAARAAAAVEGADMVLTPQASLGGFGLEDLAREPAFAAACAAWVDELAAGTADGGPALVVGAPWIEAGRLHDALHVLDGGRVLARRARHEVEAAEPFAPGPAPGPVALRGVRLGLMAGGEALGAAVPETLAETGAELLVGLGALPFTPGGAARRLERAVARVVETGLGLLVLNAAGAQDGLVCDGASFALNPDRGLALQLPACEGALCMGEWRRDAEGRLACTPLPPAPEPPAAEALWRALRLGLADQVAKGGWPGVEIPPGGGPAARLLRALAEDALGAGRVEPGGLRLAAAHRDDLIGGRVPPEAAFAPFLHLSPTALAALGAWRGMPVDLAADPARDAVLEGLLDRGEGVDALVAAGHDRALVLAAWRALARAEPARRRAPPGIRLGGRGLRLPITQGFTDGIA